jgi:hypothetical protein
MKEVKLEQDQYYVLCSYYAIISYYYLRRTRANSSTLHMMIINIGTPLKMSAVVVRRQKKTVNNIWLFIYL